MQKETASIGAQVSSNRSSLLGLLALLLATKFILGYIGHTYFSDQLLNASKPGFWVGVLSFAIATGIVIYHKKRRNLGWGDLGLAKPKNWWQPILVFVGTFGAVVLFSLYVRPLILTLGAPPAVDHLMGIRQNLPGLIFALVVVWITAAFLEELIFRAFLINSLEELMGTSKAALAFAVLISSVMFGLFHAYQGLTGILMTGSVGLIFGAAYALNGKRIWTLILLHGVIDTMGLISIYQMPV